MIPILFLKIENAVYAFFVRVSSRQMHNNNDTIACSRQKTVTFYLRHNILCDQNFRKQ